MRHFKLAEWLLIIVLYFTFCPSMIDYEKGFKFVMEESVNLEVMNV